MTTSFTVPAEPVQPNTAATVAITLIASVVVFGLFIAGITFAALAVAFPMVGPLADQFPTEFTSVPSPISPSPATSPTPGGSSAPSRSAASSAPSSSRSRRSSTCRRTRATEPSAGRQPPASPIRTRTICTASWVRADRSSISGSGRSGRREPPDGRSAPGDRPVARRVPRSRRLRPRRSRIRSSSHSGSTSTCTATSRRAGWAAVRTSSRTRSRAVRDPGRRRPLSTVALWLFGPFAIAGTGGRWPGRLPSRGGPSRSRHRRRRPGAAAVSVDMAAHRPVRRPTRRPC